MDRVPEIRCLVLRLNRPVRKVSPAAPSNSKTGLHTYLAPPLFSKHATKRLAIDASGFLLISTSQSLVDY